MPRRPAPVAEPVAPDTAPRIVPQEYELVDASTLKLFPGNAKVHDDEAIDESLAATGFYGACLVQRSTRYVIAGNGRLKGAIRKGMGKVPTLWMDVDDEVAKRINLADNRTGDRGHYDDQLLAELLQSMTSLEGTGYGKADVSALLLQIEKNALTPPPARKKTESTSPRGTTVKIVLSVEDAGTVESALQSTGEWRRDLALLRLCNDFLRQQEAAT